MYSIKYIKVRRELHIIYSRVKKMYDVGFQVEKVVDETDLNSFYEYIRLI